MSTSYVFVRSQDRSVGSSSAFSVTLPNPFRNVKAISLISAELPFGNFNIDVPYCQGVRFTYNGTPYDVSVSPGFYGVTDLQGLLLSNLQSAFPTAGISSVLFSAVTGRLSIVYSGGLTFTVASTSLGNLGRIVGTDPLGTTSIASGGVLSLPFLVNLFPVSTILMKIAEVPAMCVSTNNQACFARLQMATTPGGVVMLNNASGTVNTFAFASQIATLSSLTVSLWSPDNQAINLHGCEFSFTLMIQTA